MQNIKTYKQALEYMYAQLPMFQRQGPSAYKKDLTNTIALCEKAGNPQDDIKTIHIAGTNGKGTTTHIIAAGLQAQGYKVGVYTSPHYKDFRERIKINGKYISSSYILKFINTYKNDLEEIKPSFFEMTVALAFLYFKDQKVDYAIIETGLGGRLDSTNVISPLLSVITNISFDHQNMLGDTLEAIAGEKAGIIKSNIPVIIGERQKDIEQVFIKKAANVKSPIFFAEDYLSINLINSETQGFKTYDVNVDGKIWIRHLTTDLYGPFQEKNIITALYALYFLSNKIDINTSKIIDFFPTLKSQTNYMGRWQILANKPLIIADSAHNEGGLKIILKELVHLQYDKLHIVLGFVNDKDVSKVLDIFPKNATYYFAKANIPRGLDAKSLQETASLSGLHGKAYASVRKALAAAKSVASDQDLIYIGGSIFVVAEVI